MKDILPVIFAFAAPVSAIISVVISVVIGKRIDARREREMAEYRAEIENTNLKHTNELQRQFHVYQTKFSSFQAQETEVIRQLYAKMGETKELLGYLVHPVQTHDLTSHEHQTSEAYNDLARYYVQNSILLDEEMDKKVEEILKKMKTVLVNWQHAQRPSSNASSTQRKLDLWNDAWKSIDKEVPVLLDELKSQFRKRLTP